MSEHFDAKITLDELLSKVTPENQHPNLWDEGSIDGLTSKIKRWAVDRNLHTANPDKQMLKLFEELGELAEGMAKDKPTQITDSIGDIFVVLTILTLQLGINIEECIAEAYDEIKDRKGRMVDGVFVKESDLPTPSELPSDYVHYDINLEPKDVRDKYTASICEGCGGHGYVRFRNGGDEDCSECDGEGMRLKEGD